MATTSRARSLMPPFVLAAVRLLALTGYGQPKDLQRARAAGFDGHVVKPVDATALTALAGVVSVGESPP